MLIGIDLGTTRTIAAQADRGNYPVLTFPDTDGDPHLHLPSVTALADGRLIHGFDALREAREGAPLLRSVKRLLGDPATHPGTRVRIGQEEPLLLDVLTGFLAHVRSQLPGPGPHQAVVSVPAHAHGAQRFLTLEAFRGAGFEVLAMVNEPSAAGFEFTHRQRRSLSGRRTRVLVYDLGGGTFDASLVDADGTSHAVLDSVGINRLGGDDFDQVLADVVLEAAGLCRDELDAPQLSALLEESREAKERLTPQTRRMLVELGGEDKAPVVVAVDRFYEAAAGLVEQSIAAMEPLVGSLGKDSDVAGIYLVGGGSGLPLVPRRIRERFGRRVHRSPYPAASTAIGLAIAADPGSGVTIADRLSRGFGVFRERDSGGGVAFDAILTRDEPLPQAGERTVTRRYRAAHDLGVFRYVEHSAIDAAGEPRGDLVPFAQVVVPFDPELQRRAAVEGEESLVGLPVRRREDGPLIEETYTVDAAGIVHLRIEDLGTGFRIERGLGR
ncbi:Hsp70 family protein [Brachybacterium hainanense]|uniref:Hsp70 family protein n=1 Tax=Brachybacterium hainanense TaxID=1541174 RepID=A0ABV6RA56_9MICO